METIRIEGLKDLQRELRQIDKKLPRELRIVHKDIAEIIAEGARRRGMALGGVHRKAAPAIKAGAEQRRGFIRLRPTKTIPFLYGAEFGAHHDLPRTVKTPSGATTVRLGWNQLPPHRGNQFLGGTPGYMVYPTIRDKGEQMVDEYAKRIDALLKRAFNLTSAPRDTSRRTSSVSAPTALAGPREFHHGARGGVYYVNESGKKVYVK